MTIFQKMLVVPILSLAFYFTLFIYSFWVQNDNNQNLKQIRDQFIPMLAVVNECTTLFGQITVNLKDAVLANEMDWVIETESKRNNINQHFQWLKQQAETVDVAVINRAETSFNAYYTAAHSLAKNLISPQSEALNLSDSSSTIKGLVDSAREDMLALSNSINALYLDTVDQTNHSINQLLFWSSLVSVALFLLFVLITVGVSLATKNSIYEVVTRMKSLAEGDTDFSQRIEHKQQDEVGQLVHWFNRLSAKLEKDYQAIETLSITDKLTQLNNRTSTDQWLSEMLQQSQTLQSPFSLAIIDIDHFKQINDQHGHLVGDQVLQAFARLMKSLVNVDHFIGRWGGEEFIILMADTTLAQAMEHAQAWCQLISKERLCQLEVTASFGVTEARVGDTPDRLIYRADQALYRAKSAGRNQAVAMT